jgi:hypothetical protein
MTPHQPNDWRSLAEQASLEPDPEKFMSLVTELNRVLGEREESIHQMRYSQGASRGET